MDYNDQIKGDIVKKLIMVTTIMTIIGCDIFSNKEQSKIRYNIENESEVKIDSIRIDFCEKMVYSMININGLDSFSFSIDSNHENICHEGISSVNIFRYDTTFVIWSGYHPPIYNNAMIHIFPDSIYSSFNINEGY